MIRSKSRYNGINIQFPISQLIIDEKKTVETRTYPIPEHYVGQEMALVETPGKTGGFESRIIAIIRFGPCFKYKSKSAFYADSKRHRVTPDSPWAWKSGKGKWGWPVEVVRVLKKPISPKKRIGIKYTRDIEI